MKKIIFTLLIFMPLSLTAQWEILNEGFKGRINTIDFVNDNVGWIAGSNGTLLKTTDGGENWINIPVDETWNIDAIDFINESIGWAIGSAYIDPNWKNYIWKTTDGGNTWVQQFISTVFGFNSLYVIDATNVFAVGGNKIYKTSNGGTNWINVSPNLLERNYNSLWFQDSQTGVVGGHNYGIANGGIILRTSNGGTSWNETIVNEFNKITDLQFLDNGTGYFKANNDSVSLLLRTEDMFSSWSIIASSRYGMGPYHFIDNNNAFAVMAESTTESSILKSIDGGVNWLTVNSFDNRNWFPKIHFNKIDNGFLLNSIWSSSRLLRSTDSGYNWKVQEFSYPLNDVCIYDDDKGIIVGGKPYRAHSESGSIYTTSDGGKTWNLDYDYGREFKSCVFVNELVAFSVGRREIFRSSDGGNNWIIVYPDSGGFRGSDICFINENTGWAVGEYFAEETNGAGILSTIDGGESWDLGWQFNNTTNYEYNLNSIHFINSTGWSVGDGGMILKYTEQNGWVKQNLVTTLPLNKVFFSDDNNGWIAGGYQNDNGFQKILIKTTDGGLNWSTVSNVPYLIRGIAFIDNNRGWAIGYTESGEGGILETVDGGITWNIDTGNLSSELNALFIKDNYGWAVGENGLILRTTDAGAVWVEDENNNTYPTEFVLEQNYPNPFNPVTKIKYEIPDNVRNDNVKVTLKVYDVIGREVSILVDEEQQPGVYEVEFNVAQESIPAIVSGVYFYGLQAGSYTATKKMLLLK